MEIGPHADEQLPDIGLTDSDLLCKTTTNRGVFDLKYAANSPFVQFKLLVGVSDRS